MIFPRPSSAERWSRCPASVSMCQRYALPSQDSSAAVEGTIAHATAMQYLQNGTWPHVPAEMIEGGKLFADAVTSKGLPLYIENGTYASALFNESGGTPDVYCIDEKNFILYVFDYKFGYQYVDVVNNKQLTYYAAEIIKLHNLNDQLYRVVFTIIQPRSFGQTIRSWGCLAADLRADINILKMAAENAMSDNPKLQTGAYCKNCSGRHACKAIRSVVYEIADIAMADNHAVLSPDELGKELAMLEEMQTILDARISGLQVQAMEELRSGARVPGYQISQEKGRLKWKDEKEAIALGELLGIKITKKAEPITPLQAEKLGFPIGDYAERQNGEMKLTRINMSNIAQIFKE